MWGGGGQCFWLGTSCKSIWSKGIFQHLPLVWVAVCFWVSAQGGGLKFYGFLFIPVSGHRQRLAASSHSCLDLHLYLSGTSEGCLTCDFRLVEKERGQAVFPNKVFCCGMMFSGLIISEVRLCFVPSPPLTAIGASITLISAHLRKRRKRKTERKSA